MVYNINMNIYPSILETSIEGFESTFLKELPHFSYFQIDISDGEFVEKKTVEIHEVHNILTNHLELLIDKSFEFHLMVKDVSHYLNELTLLQNISIKRVLFPIQYPPEFHDYKNPLGFVLNPEDTVEDYWETISKSNMESIQIMTVHPGSQGQPFMPECLNKIDVLRERGFTGSIILDGCINNRTLPIILQNKHLPTDVCPGSYFKADTANHLQILQELIRNA